MNAEEIKSKSLDLLDQINQWINHPEKQLELINQFWTMAYNAGYISAELDSVPPIIDFDLDKESINDWKMDYPPIDYEYDNEFDLMPSQESDWYNGD